MRAVARRLAILTVVGTTLATAAGAAARASWVLELFTHFPVQYLVLQVLAAGACLAVRRWRWALLALIAALPNLLALQPYLRATLVGPAARMAAPAPAPAPTAINLVAANLLYRQEDPTAALAYLKARSPDLVVLSEFTPRWREKLRVLERTYPYFALRPRWNAWGIGVYSRLPFQAIEDLDLGDDRSSHLRLLVQLPDGLVELYAVHLASPTRPWQADQRDTQLRRLAARIQAADPALPKIVAGDFNLTPFSPRFRDLLRDTGLRDTRPPFGLQATWPAWLVPAWLPIDHCLAGGPVDVTRVAAGPKIGSDHRPLECTFSLAS